MTSDMCQQQNKPEHLSSAGNPGAAGLPAQPCLLCPVSPVGADWGSLLPWPQCPRSRVSGGLRVWVTLSSSPALGLCCFASKTPS